MFDSEKQEQESKPLPWYARVPLAAIAVSTAVFLAGASEGIATLKYGSNKVPAAAIKLPGHRNNVANYLVPTSEVDQVHCGPPITWLPHRIFDLDMDQERLTTQEYKHGQSVTTADLDVLARHDGDHYEIIACVETFGV